MLAEPLVLVNKMEVVKKEKQKGQSLWEVILALGVASLIALGLVRSTTSSVKSSRYSVDESRATALAQAKLNEVINDKEKNSVEFWNKVALAPPQGHSYFNGFDSSGYCVVIKLFDASSLLTPAPGNAMMAKIEVDVFWDEKSGGNNYCGTDFSHSVHLETYVTN